MHPGVALTVLFFSLIWSGCGSQTDQTAPTKSAPLDESDNQAAPKAQIVARVRSEIAAILKKEPSQIDVAKSLLAQGADDLDIVEIVMAIEEAFDVKIPDSAIVDSARNVDSKLTALKLAQIVSDQQAND